MSAAAHDAPVLVVLVNNRVDWQRVVDEHWYRIPLKHAPLPAAASFLAFYQSRVFGDDAYRIRFYAAVERYHLVTRRELLPDEPDHPRAGERYYRVELAPVQELGAPIRSRRLRRITFIPTTLGRLWAAEEINDLWLGDGVEELLWELFRDAGIKAERSLRIGEGQAWYVVPMAVPYRRDGRSGGLAIFCDSRHEPQRVGNWLCLHLPPEHIRSAPAACMERVYAALWGLE